MNKLLPLCFMNFLQNGCLNSIYAYPKRVTLSSWDPWYINNSLLVWLVVKIRNLYQGWAYSFPMLTAFQKWTLEKDMSYHIVTICWKLQMNDGEELIDTDVRTSFLIGCALWLIKYQTILILKQVKIYFFRKSKFWDLLKTLILKTVSSFTLAHVYSIN